MFSKNSKGIPQDFQGNPKIMSQGIPKGCFRNPKGNVQEFQWISRKNLQNFQKDKNSNRISRKTFLKISERFPKAIQKKSKGFPKETQRGVLKEVQ